MYGRPGRQQLARAVYMNDLARHQALTRGGTSFAGWGGRDIDVKRLDRVRGRRFHPETGYQGYFGSGGGNFDAGFPTTQEVEVSDVYQEGSGPQLQQAYANRAKRRKNALYGMALRAFMKLRKGLPLTDVEKRALQKVGGPAGLQEFFGPQGIDVESAAQEGHIVDLAPEDQVLAQEAVNGTTDLGGEEMSYATILLLAGAVGGGIYLLGKALK